MADEIKKVISVDLGNTSTSLKDYKKHIDQLRGSLLQLDETSEEYAKISKEIKTEQDKLNEVMKVGKINTDAAEGSYNQLAQTMAELKKQWKATADEAERANLGKQILDINNQLKELDASTGNYQRNVGDYTNAFEQAFDKCLDGITKLDGPIGELGGTVKNLIPVIKSVNATAVAGLSGVKKAIASTGIGLLIIAIGELITHWDKFTKLIGITSEDMNEFKEKAINTLSSIISGAIGVGNVIGNFLVAPVKAAIKSFEGLGNVVKDVFTGNWSKIKEDATNAIDSIGNVWKKAFDISENYAIGKEAGEKFVNGLKEAFSETDDTGEISDTSSNTPRIKIDLIPNLKPIDATTIDKVKEDFKDKLNELKNEYEQDKFEFSLISDTLSEQEKLDELFRIDSEYILKQQELLGQTDELRQKYSNLRKKYDKDTADNGIKEAEREAKIKKQLNQSILSSSVALFGALSELSEEGSEEQKAFSIMQTVLNTLQSIMGIWAGYSPKGPLGIAAASVQTAAVIATGAATIAKMKSTTKDTASSGASVSPPRVSTPSMATVNPLLDEQQDINRIEMSGIQGDSSKNMQNLRVYVVDQDIRDANYKASVVESNSTY
jgi:predicted  nucleic acid-binding Zn-ribbon protein